MPSTPIKRPKYNLDLRSRGYVFTVALLAVMFIELLIFRPRGADHVAETVLTYVSDEHTSREGVLIDPKATVTISQHLLREIREPAFLETVLATGEFDLSRPAPSIAEISASLLARVEGQGDRPSTLRIRLTSPRVNFARSFLDAVARVFAEKHTAAAPESNDYSEQIAVTRSTVQQWQDRCQHLESTQQQLVQHELARLQTSHRATIGLSDQLNRVAPKPAPGFRDRPQANPTWIELQKELKASQKEVQRMLETYTPEHPSVLQMMSEIEAIRQELQRTERTTTPVETAFPIQLAEEAEHSPSFAEPVPVEAPSISIAAPDTPEATTDTAAAPRIVAEDFDEHEAHQTIVASEEYQQFAASLANAKEKLVAAEAHLAGLRLSNETQTVAEDKPHETATVESPARIVKVFRPPFTPKHLLQMIGPAALLGFTLSLGRRPTPLPAFFCSKEDVETSLGMPMISAVSRPKGPMFDMPANPTSKFVIVAIRIAEGIVIGTVMLIVMGLVTLPDFAAQMTTNPFNAFCIGLDHLESFFTS